MALKPGDTAAPDDIWLHNISHRNDLSKDGRRIKHARLRGRVHRPEAGRAWASEISGRLRSLSPNDDVRRAGEEAAEHRRKKASGGFDDIAFLGVLYVGVHQFADWRTCKANVVYDPIEASNDTPADLAHAVIAIYDREPDADNSLTVIQSLIDDLSTFLSVERLGELPEAGTRA